jgi:hypothetical protein
MGTAIRLCAGIAVVALALYVAILALPIQDTSPPDCGAGFCDVTAADLFALLFVVVGSLFATLTAALVVTAAFRTRQGVLGVALALLIFTNFAVAIVYLATNGFQSVLYDAPGAYFASGGQLPWYFGVATITFAIMLALGPLPSLLFTPGSRAHSSALAGEPGLRQQIPQRLALTSLLLAGVSLIVLDRVVDHYTVVGVGPEWPLLASTTGFYVFWLVAWFLLMASLLRLSIHSHRPRLCPLDREGSYRPAKNRHQTAG